MPVSGDRGNWPPWLASARASWFSMRLSQWIADESTPAPGDAAPTLPPADVAGCVPVDKRPIMGH